MIQITPQMRVLVAVEPVDFRRGIDGLVNLCRETLRNDPFSGTVFVFRRRGSHLLGLLDVGTGYELGHREVSLGAQYVNAEKFLPDPNGQFLYVIPALILDGLGSWNRS